VGYDVQEIMSVLLRS